MHVLLASNRFDTDPSAGGSEMLAADLARALADRSVQVTWLAAPDQRPDESTSPTQVRRIQLTAPSASSPPARWQARERANQRALVTALQDVPRVDLVHAMHFSRMGLGTLAGGPFVDVPMVATLTDYTAVCADYQMVHRGRRRPCRAPVSAKDCSACLAAPPASKTVTSVEIDEWRRHNLTLLNRRCAAVWVQTPHQRRTLVRAGLQARRVIRDTAAYAIPERWCRPSTVSVETPTLLFLGRASPDKGLHVLLEAFRCWSGQARLRVVTTPDDAGYEQRMRRMASHDNRIEWLPPVSRDELEGVLVGATGLLVPSQWHDNHPMVVHYAQALGVPVLCSAVPSLAHLADHGGVRFVEHYRDPSAWLAAVDDFVTRPTVSINRLAEFRYAWERFVDETLAVYLRLAGQR